MEYCLIYVVDLQRNRRWVYYSILIKVAAANIADIQWNGGIESIALL